LGRKIIGLVEAVVKRSYQAILGGALIFALTACGGQGTATETVDDGWVVLDDVEIDVDSIVLSSPTEQVVAPEEMDRATAENILPFDLTLPGWVPAGFAALELVEVVVPENAQPDDYASVIVTWEDEAGAQVQLQVSANAVGPQFGAAGASEAVSVNGNAATLVETQGLGRSRITLSWGHTGLDYRLTAEGGALESADLLRMAESIP
jgi:hypothetical protein